MLVKGSKGCVRSDEHAFNLISNRVESKVEISPAIIPLLKGCAEDTAKEL